MGVAKKALLLVIRAADSLVNTALLLVLLLTVAYGCYGLWDSAAVTEAAEAKQYEQYKPTQDGGPSFQELQALNPETIAWLQVYGTNIDYPVLQADNNWKYINNNALCEYSLTGSIFADCGNSGDFTDFNTILYGHNMTPRVMFGSLKEFKGKEFFESHPYGDLFFAGKHHGLEFFAMLSTDAYDPEIYSPKIADGRARQAYLDRLTAISTYTRDVGVSIDDRIVLLSTCSNEETNLRDILAARITDTTYTDEFAPKTEEPVRTVTGIDVRRAEDMWSALPLWAWVCIALALALAFSAVIYRAAAKHRKKVKKHER